MILAILGLGGVGRVIAKSAARKGRFDQVICADLDRTIVDSALEAVNNKSFRGKVVDASNPEQVRKLAGEADILVNATIPRFNLVVMEGCRSAGALWNWHRSRVQQYLFSLPCRSA